MLRRLKWMAIGAGVGAGSSWWAHRQARRAAANLTPLQVGKRLGREASARLGAARREARSAMTDTERRLRNRE